MRVGVYTRIVIGYIFLLFIVVFIGKTISNEREQRMQMEQQISEIHKVQSLVSEIHRSIIKLSLLGESVVIGGEKERMSYHKQNKELDSLILFSKQHYAQLIPIEPLDTLNHLLAAKENCLMLIMQSISHRNYSDSLLLHQLPSVSKRATQPKYVTKKKKGLLGILGGKKKIEIPPSTTPLFALNDSIIKQQQEHIKEMSLYANRLNLQNSLLNEKLNDLSFASSLCRF